MPFIGGEITNLQGIEGGVKFEIDIDPDFKNGCTTFWLNGDEGYKVTLDANAITGEAGVTLAQAGLHVGHKLKGIVEATKIVNKE